MILESWWKGLTWVRIARLQGFGTAVRRRAVLPAPLKGVTRTRQLRGSTLANQRPRFGVDRRGACRPRPAADGTEGSASGQAEPLRKPNPRPAARRPGESARGRAAKGPAWGRPPAAGPASRHPRPEAFLAPGPSPTSRRGGAGRPRV